MMPGYLYEGNRVVTSLYEDIMRALFALLALVGIAGILFGVLTIIRGMQGPHGVPFSYENYGGPGPIIAGVIVLAVSLYLRSIWASKES